MRRLPLPVWLVVFGSSFGCSAAEQRPTGAQPGGSSERVSTASQPVDGGLANSSSPEAPDRVVAVVGEHRILFADLSRRARPHLNRLDIAGGDATRRTAQKATVLREVLERMIDEWLEEREAVAARVTVTDADVDRGIAQIAALTRATSAEVLAEAQRQGLSEADYRAEIRRQVLEAKLVQLRVRERVRVTEADARNVYATWVKTRTGPNAPIDPQRDAGAGPPVPTFESVQDRMMERAFSDATERERRLWIQQLRKPVVIEVRL